MATMAMQKRVDMKQCFDVYAKCKHNMCNLGFQKCIVSLPAEEVLREIRSPEEIGAVVYSSMNHFKNKHNQYKNMTLPTIRPMGCSILQDIKCGAIVAECTGSCVTFQAESCINCMGSLYQQCVGCL